MELIDYQAVKDELTKILDRYERINHPRKLALIKAVERLQRYIDGMESNPPKLAEWVEVTRYCKEVEPVALHEQPDVVYVSPGQGAPIREEIAEDDDAWQTWDEAYEQNQEKVDAQVGDEVSPNETVVAVAEEEVKIDAALHQEPDAGEAQLEPQVTEAQAMMFGTTKTEVEADLLPVVFGEMPPSLDEDQQEIGEEAQANSRFIELVQRAEADLRGDDDALKRAINALENLEQSDSLSKANRTQVDGILNDARSERARRVEALLARGRQARKVHDDETARKAFAAAYSLDHNNQQVSNSLNELNASAVRTASEQEINQLEIGLAIRNDLSGLERAVRQAELLWSEGRLPDRLRPAMQEARRYFDSRRASFGLITTNAMMGSLKDSYKAIADIENLIKDGEQSFPDPYTGGMVEINQALRNARMVWSDRSKEYIEDTRRQVEKYLEQEPRISRSILERRLGSKDSPNGEEPIHEGTLSDVEAIKEQVRKRNDAYDEAQQYSDEADKASDALLGLARCIEAYTRFAYLPGLKIKTDRYRQQALDFLEVLINNQFTTMATGLDEFQFTTATDAVLEAQKLITRWPEQDKPELLQRLNQVCADHMRHIGQSKSKHDEFEKQYKKACLLEDSGDLEGALNIMRALFVDERYSKDARYKRFRAIVNDLVQKVSKTKSQTERLAMARDAARNSEAGENEWTQVLELTEELKSTSDEARVLYAQADMMLRIAEVQDYVKSARVTEAADKILPLMRLYPASVPLLVQEEAVIQAAQAATPAMKALYDEAIEKAKKTGVTERAAALRIFRYLAGTPANGTQVPADWPAYCLTLYTAPARERMRLLSEDLREKDLPELLKAHRDYLEQKKEPLDDLRKTMAEKARALRTVYLLENEDERAAARWLEISQGQADADGVAANGNWDLAVDMWEELDLYYPRTPVIRSGLRKAYIQQSLQRARMYASQGQPEKALQVLQLAESEHDLLDSLELRLAITLAHEKLGSYTEALETLQLTNLTGLDETQRSVIDRERKRIARERQIAAALNQMGDLQRQAEAPGTPESSRRKFVREALTVLRDANIALGDTGSHRLERDFANLYISETNKLINHIEAQLAKRTPAGHLEALLSSVDLEQVEDIKGVEEKNRSSRGFQRQLEGEPLRKLIIHLNQRWGELNPDATNPSFAYRGVQASIYDMGERKDGRYSTITAVQLYEQVTDLRDKVLIATRLIETLDGNGRGRKAAAKTQAASAMNQFERNLENLTTQISILLDGLQDLLKKDQTALVENSSQPWQNAVLIGETTDEWELAVAGDSFERLGGILSKLQEYKLHQVRDVQIFAQRYQETQLVHEHLKKGILSIRKDFRDEAFARVVSTIESLRQIRSMENSDDLVYMDDARYEQIYQWIGMRLRVVGDQSSGDLRGWEAVCVDAAHREHNYLAWADWRGDETSKQKTPLLTAIQKGMTSFNLALWFRFEIPWRGDDMQRAYQDALNCDALPPNSRGWLPALSIERNGVYKVDFINPKGEAYPAELVSADLLPLRFCAWAWENAVNYLSNALLELNSGPQPTKANLSAFPALSQKASALKEEAVKAAANFENYLNEAKSFLSQALAQIDMFGGFPLPGEVINIQRQKNLPKMQERYAQARKIGPANLGESRTFYNMKGWMEQQGKKKRFGFF